LIHATGLSPSSKSVPAQRYAAAARGTEARFARRRCSERAANEPVSIAGTMKGMPTNATGMSMSSIGATAKMMNGGKAKAAVQVET
jgi:hypothetical protein